MLSARDRGLTIFLLAWKSLSISKTSPCSGAFSYFISTTKPTFRSREETWYNLQFSAFLGNRGQTSYNHELPNINLQELFDISTQVLQSALFQVLMNVSVSICWMVKRLLKKETSGETFKVSTHMYPFTAPTQEFGTIQYHCNLSCWALLNYKELYNSALQAAAELKLTSPGLDSIYCTHAQPDRSLETIVYDQATQDGCPPALCTSPVWLVAPSLIPYLHDWPSYIFAPAPACYCSNF